jgi:hypothetical protein
MKFLRTAEYTKFDRDKYGDSSGIDKLIQC